ncbi:MAG: hypothetical protein ACREKS_14480 [Candidatus Rokuibacteriota bacterium]
MAWEVAGLTLDFTEVVTEWVPGRHKTWETVGNPRIIIMAHYRIRFTLSLLEHGTLLTLELEYDPRQSWWGRVLSWLLADWYGRWCLRRIGRDAKIALEVR